MSTLHLCQAGYEPFLAKELGGPPESSGPGWVLGPDPPGEPCFAHLSLCEPALLLAKSVNAMSGALADFFLGSARAERFSGPWPYVVEAAGLEGLARRAHTVEAEALAGIRARMSRVAKLSIPGRPRPGRTRGLFAYLPDFERVFAAREAFSWGQRRMTDDPRAPSRSYLKAEEAYAILGREPAAGESVVDLGAAPGGWTYSAARRGARVLALDNGALKGDARHPGVTHLEMDAFTFKPPGPVDWMFCDVVDEPERVLDLLARWLDEGWCRRFIVALKFGRHDPLRLLTRARALKPRTSVLRIRQLFHDREELTLMGERPLPTRG